jgi:hypothetical protein
MVAALVTAEQMEGMGANRQWQASNKLQLQFLEQFFKPCRREVDTIPEIESLASWDVEEINAFLRQRGFTIQLRPFGPATFGVASVLDLLVEWVQKGEVRTVRGIDNRDYPAVRMSQESAKFYEVGGHPHPIVALETKTGDVVYMTMLDSEPAHEFDLIDQVEGLSHAIYPTYQYGGVIFPMVDLDQKVDITWLIGLTTTGVDGGPATVAQALQQNILKINEVGARAKSAVAIAVTRASRMPEPDLVINGPFLVWFERSGLAKPLFTGYITQEHWKNPGSLK